MFGSSVSSLFINVRSSVCGLRCWCCCCDAGVGRCWEIKSPRVAVQIFKNESFIHQTINHMICELYVTGVVLIALSSSRMVGAIVGFGPEQDRTTVPRNRLLLPTEGLGLEVLLYYWLHSLLWSDVASFEWSRCIQSPECEDDIGVRGKDTVV
jgi:hypothetical protein